MAQLIMLGTLALLALAIVAVVMRFDPEARRVRPGSREGTGPLEGERR
jgi:hypothetical protein